MDSSTHAETVHEPPSDESIHAGHEVRDVNIRVLLWLGAAVGGGVIVVLLVLIWLVNGLEATAKSSDPELSPLAETVTTTAAPGLQDTPVRDYLEFRQEQEEALNTYGWVDRQAEIVRLPIARAMELILEEGLPEPKAKATEKTDSQESETEMPNAEETSSASQEQP